MLLGGRGEARPPWQKRGAELDGKAKTKKENFNKNRSWVKRKEGSTNGRQK